MKRVLISPRARKDLLEIGDYIAAENPAGALSFVARIEARCRDIAGAPLAAPARPELGDGVRVVPFRRYLIFYTLHSDTVRIERVLHGARNLGALFP